MAFTENDKAYVRQFLNTTAAQSWMQHALDNIVVLKLGDSDVKSYNISLYQKAGAEVFAKFLIASAQEDTRPDYGTSSIDTVTD